jgi:hypothetical protein
VLYTSSVSYDPTEPGVELFLTNMIVLRHGFDPTAILLVNYRLRRLSTARNKIWLVGFGVHAICLVRSQLHQVSNLTMNSATASKTNWITLTTGVSHERIQVFHRWTAYAFFLLALMHTFPFIVYHIHFHDMVMHFEMSLLFYWTGIVALIFQAWLTFASHSVIR